MSGFKKDLNKWQLIWNFRRAWMIGEPGWRVVDIGVIRITSYPEEGVEFSKSNYDGFLLSFYLWLPWQSTK